MAISSLATVGGTIQIRRIITQISCKARSNEFNFRNNNEEYLSMKHAEKIKDVKHILEAQGGKQPLQCMVMVDTLQRLGIEYHFQKEIEAQLLRLYETTNYFIYESQDLGPVSLYFRLLRQQGFYVHADIFNKFKSNDGKFIKKMVMKDIRSVMELYEASQLRIDGEYILDEAENLSSQLLSDWMITNVDQAVMIANTLKHPYRKSLARFKTVDNILLINKFPNGKDDTWGNTLQELSCMDSFVLKNIHRMELSKISKWWDEMGLAEELKLARNQLLKWYTWSMTILSDLSLSDERIELTKSVALIYILDDIFDLYGNPQELSFFNKAVNRWDLDALEQLPDYMKSSFRVLYDFVHETAHKIGKKHGSSPLISLKKSWASLCNAFLVEAKWFASKETPMAEEYLKNGMVSSGVHVVLLHCLFLLGLGENTITSQDSSGIISSVATILRLWDDLGSAQDEDQDGHDGSYINYYMKEQHQLGVSVESAREHVVQMISNEWKLLNRECLRSSSSFHMCALNFARIIPLMYDYDDNGNLPFLQQYIESMFYNDNFQPKSHPIVTQRKDP